MKLPLPAQLLRLRTRPISQPFRSPEPTRLISTLSLNKNRGRSVLSFRPACQRTCAKGTGVGLVPRGVQTQSVRGYQTQNDKMFRNNPEPPRRCSSLFTKQVIEAMRKLYPEELADSSWDNTGLLLEAPEGPHSVNLSELVLLTIDLTQKVADEAIEKGASVVVAYHPIIFKKLSSLTLANSQQNTLLRLAAAGISVYCPHTAVDSVPDGLADWLADMVAKDTRSNDFQPPPTFYEEHSFLMSSVRSQDMAHPSLSSDCPIAHIKRPIIPAANVAKYPTAGMGRVVTFAGLQSFSKVLERIWQGLGKPASMPTAIPQEFTAATGLDSYEEPLIHRVAVCAGSGASVFASLPPVAPGDRPQAEDRLVTDLLFTGEMSHHDALAAVERGQIVVAPGHSVTERAYLHQVMRPTLEEELRQRSANATVVVSENDRDPFMSVIRQFESTRPVGRRRWSSVGAGATPWR